MRVIERGSDRWRHKRCPGCSSDLLIDDADIEVERSWDGEDGCFDSRAYVICVVCQKKFMLEIPSALRELKLSYLRPRAPSGPAEKQSDAAS